MCETGHESAWSDAGLGNCTQGYVGRLYIWQYKF